MKNIKTYKNILTNKVFAIFCYVLLCFAVFWLCFPVFFCLSVAMVARGSCEATLTPAPCAQEKRGLIWTPGEEARSSPTTKTSYEQVRFIPCSQHARLCSLLFVTPLDLSLRPRLCPHPCLCLPSVHVCVQTWLSLNTRRRVRTTRLWTICLWTRRQRFWRNNR